MIRTTSRLLTASLIFLATLGVASAGAAERVGPSLEGPAAETVLDGLRRAQPDLPVLSIAPAPIPGLYVVSIENGTMLYVTEDGGYLFAGDLYAITDGGFVNETEVGRSEQRADLLAGVDPTEQIIFAPRGEAKSFVTVFTDVDCGFCQKLHREVPALNAMGIEVRYMAYPRAGIGTESYAKIASAWCADDRKATLTALKFGEPVEVLSCDNPVASQYRLGQQLGVRGTPALFTADGRYLPGYMPAADLAEELGVTR